jgi:hypothetical protein
MEQLPGGSGDQIPDRSHRVRRGDHLTLPHWVHGIGGN